MFVKHSTELNRHGTDPYAWWCGRGGAARRPSIPIVSTFRSDVSEIFLFLVWKLLSYKLWNVVDLVKKTI